MEQSTRGFTLIEIVMTLVIVGLILAVAAPQWNKYLTYWEMETEARKIMATIREAQNKAILDHRPCRVVFDTAEESYRIESFNAAWQEAKTVDFTGRDVYISGTTLPYQTSATLPPNATDPAGYVITFDEFGTVSQDTFPSPQGQVTLSTKDNSRSLVIYINKITGSISINQ